MAIDQRLNDIQNAQAELRAFAEEFRSHRDGGGDGGGMDQRLGRLEAQYDRLTDRVGEVEKGLATLTERVAHLPSKGFIVNALLVSLAVTAALIAFGEKLQQLVS